MKKPEEYADDLEHLSCPAVVQLISRVQAETVEACHYAANKRGNEFKARSTAMDYDAARGCYCAADAIRALLDKEPSK